MRKKAAPPNQPSRPKRGPIPPMPQRPSSTPGTPFFSFSPFFSSWAEISQTVQPNRSSEPSGWSFFFLLLVRYLAAMAPLSPLLLLSIRWILCSRIQHENYSPLNHGSIQEVYFPIHGFNLPPKNVVPRVPPVGIQLPISFLR